MGQLHEYDFEETTETARMVMPRLVEYTVTVTRVGGGLVALLATETSAAECRVRLAAAGDVEMAPRLLLPPDVRDELERVVRALIVSGAEYGQGSVTVSLMGAL